MPKIYQNLSGTTKNSFRIGKRGPEIIRGYGHPDDFEELEDDPLLPDSSMYMDQHNGDIYIKKNRVWVLLNKDYDTYNYFTFLAQQETIRDVIDIVYAEKREKSQPMSAVMVILTVWLLSCGILGGIFIFLLISN